jgi:hypothetical protein
MEKRSAMEAAVMRMFQLMRDELRRGDELSGDEG